MNDKQFETLVSMINENTAKLEQTREELIALNQQNRDEIAALNQQNRDEIAALNQQNRDEIAALSQQNKDELIALNQQTKDELVALNQQTKDELNSSIEEVRNETKELRKELNQKTDILLQFITKSATGLRNEFKNNIKESEERLNKSINSVRDELRTYKQINSREHQTIIDTMEERYSAHEKEIVTINQGLSTVYALSKLNDMQHKEYDRILKENNLT